MKKIYLVSAIALASLLSNKAQAQLSVHIGFNVPVRQVYAPAPVYAPVYDDSFDNSDDYYYLPDVEAYYSVPLNCYFYNDGDRWLRAPYLPGAYRNYDWRNARRFEIRGRRPYMNHDVYRGRWGGNPDRNNWGRGRNDYANRGDRDDRRGGFAWPDRNHDREGWRGQQRSDRNEGGPREGWRGQQQPDRHQSGDREGWRGQQQQPDRNQGGGSWGGQHNGGGQQQPDRNQGGGSWGGQHNGVGGQQQPAQPINGGGNQHGGGRQDRGNGGGGQLAQNNGRQDGFNRPGRF